VTNITLGGHEQVGYRRLAVESSNPVASSQFHDGLLKLYGPAAVPTADLQEYLAAPERM
jgi:hypothetical protein